MEVDECLPARSQRSSRRNWILAAVLGIALSTLLAVVTYMLNPVLYTATEMIRISSNDEARLFGNFANVNLDQSAYNVFKNTQRQILLQPFALRNALKASFSDFERLSIGHVDDVDDVDWLARNLNVSLPESSTIMTVSLTLPDPVKGHKIVKSVVDNYMNDVVLKERMEQISRIDRLERISRELENRIREKQNELHQLRSALGLSGEGAYNFAQQVANQQLTLNLTERRKVESDLFDAQNEIDLEGSTYQSATPNATEPSQDRIRLRSRIALLEKQRERLKTELQNLETDTKKLNRSSIDVELLELDIENLRPIMEKVRQTLEQLRIDQSSPDQIICLPSAGVPEFGDSRMRIRRSAIAGLVGLSSTFVVLLGLHLVRRSPHIP